MEVKRGQLAEKQMETISTHGLGEDVGELWLAGNMTCGDMTLYEIIVDKMIIDLDVLGPFMEYWINSNMESSCTVTRYLHRMELIDAKWAKQGPEPNQLNHRMIFNLGRRPSRSFLLLGLPGHNTSSKHDERITCPVWVAIGPLESDSEESTREWIPWLGHCLILPKYPRHISTETRKCPDHYESNFNPEKILSGPKDP